MADDTATPSRPRTLGLEEAANLADTVRKLAEIIVPFLHRETLVLAGKDYFTVYEAAAYAGISYSHWRARIQPYFPPGEFFGKLLYRRADVQRFIEENARWPLSTGAAVRRISTGPRAAVSTDGPSVGSRRMMRRPRGSGRKSSLL